MGDYIEILTYVLGAMGAIAAVYLELRTRSGLEERLAVVEHQIEGLPDTVQDHSSTLAVLDQRVSGLETFADHSTRSSYRTAPPTQTETDPQRCSACGRYRKK